MTEGNGLYYMRARFYSAAMKRFVNQDVLLGNLSEGQTLNRFAFVTGQPVNLVDPFGLESRPLNSKEKQIVIEAINQIKDYGFLEEAGEMMLLLNQGQIRIDTELLKSEEALGQAGKFFVWIALAPELFQMDFDLYVVPTIAHEHAHLVDWRYCIVPMDKFLFHGFTAGWFVEDYPNQMGRKMHDHYLKMHDHYLKKQQQLQNKENR